MTEQVLGGKNTACIWGGEQRSIAWADRQAWAAAGGRRLIF